jgi:hypothetical protein
MPSARLELPADEHRHRGAVAMTVAPHQLREREALVGLGKSAEDRTQRVAGRNVALRKLFLVLRTRHVGPHRR